MARMCLRFYCDLRGDRYCCADCRNWKDCRHPCMNHPTRCKLVDDGSHTGKRRGRPRKEDP